MSELVSAVTRTHLLLLALASLLTAVALWQGFVRQPELPEIPVAPAAILQGLQKRGDVAVAAADPQRFSDASSRPLFNPSRVRFVLPQASVAQGPVAAAPFRAPVLLGIAGVNGKRLALVRLPDEREARRLREGDAYEGWRVAAIKADAVVFRNGSEERELRLVAREAGASMPAPRR